MACPFVAATGASAGAGVTPDDRAGEGAGANLASRIPGASSRPDDGDGMTGATTGAGAIAGAAIAEARGIRSAPSRAAWFVGAPGADAGTGLACDARAGEGAGANMVRPVPGATTRPEEGSGMTGATTGGPAIAAGAIAVPSCAGGTAFSLTVPVG
jgi:hypothetical protein